MDLLLVFSTDDEDEIRHMTDFARRWPGNFMLQKDVIATTPIEITLKETATKIDNSIYNLGQQADTKLMDLISAMRVLWNLLFVYNSETRLMESYCENNSANFRNTILWVSNLLERRIIVNYKIQNNDELA